MGCAERGAVFWGLLGRAYKAITYHRLVSLRDHYHADAQEAGGVTNLSFPAEKVVRSWSIFSS